MKIFSKNGLYGLKNGKTVIIEAKYNYIGYREKCDCGMCNETEYFVYEVFKKESPRI